MRYRFERAFRHGWGEAQIREGARAEIRERALRLLERAQDRHWSWDSLMRVLSTLSDRYCAPSAGGPPIDLLRYAVAYVAYAHPDRHFLCAEGGRFWHEFIVEEIRRAREYREGAEAVR